MNLSSRDPDSRLVSPIVKWAGGKSSIVSRLCLMAPKSFRAYFEPFAGGAAMFFRLIPKVAWLGDLNPGLICAYREVRDDAVAVYNGIAKIFADHRKRPRETYALMRDVLNDYLTTSLSPSQLGREQSLRIATAFLYLNRVCFNGLYRVNKKGLFNVPLGDRDGTRKYLPLDVLVQASRHLARAQLECCDYASLVSGASSGDFVYFDPPYLSHQKSGASFTSYTNSGFNEENQRELAECARKLVSRGAGVMISDADTRASRRVYARAGLRLVPLRVRRSIAVHAASPRYAAEIVAVGGYS